MLDVKLWLESTGMKVAEEYFIKPPTLPYLIFKEEIDVTRVGNKECIANRQISIELYSEKVNHESENKIEVLLNEKSIDNKKSRTWIESEKFFQTMYDFNLYEKI